MYAAKQPRLFCSGRLLIKTLVNCLLQNMYIWMNDLTLFEALTGGAFDRLNWKHSGECDQNFSKRSNVPGFARGDGWFWNWLAHYAEDLQREVSNLWCCGVVVWHLWHFFCRLSREFFAADRWIWSCKELGPFEFNCAEHWVLSLLLTPFPLLGNNLQLSEIVFFLFCFSWLDST